jgi:glutathione S-transferase
MILLQVLGDGQQGAEAVASCAYLRDRIGVPRDLDLPAARQLRAHLNWFIDAVSYA